jgi:hypothetical protein
MIVLVESNLVLELAFQQEEGDDADLIVRMENARQYIESRL